MVLTHNITHYPGRFLVGLITGHALFLHTEQDTTVYRLQAVAHIRQGPANDNAHGIIEIRVLHLILDVHGYDLIYNTILAGSFAGILTGIFRYILFCTLASVLDKIPFSTLFGIFDHIFLVIVKLFISGKLIRHQGSSPPWHAVQ